MDKSKSFVFLFILLFVCSFFPESSIFAQLSRSERIRQTLEAEKEQVEKQKTKLEELTGKERLLYKNLAEIEDRIQSMSDKLARQKENLRSLEAKGERLLDEFARVSLQKTETTARLKELLSGLWPIHVTDIQNRVTGLSSWANADRQFTWMAAIYERIMQEFEKLETQSETLSRNLADQKRIKKALQSEVAEVESTKDELLKEKLSFLRKVQEVRVMKLKQEEQLQAILSTVESMEFELHTLTDRSFSRLQGHLPWPGNGKIVSTFNPSANPPKRGIGIVVHDNQPVTAVSWGKVVHNDQLRGFGRVVILSHGEEYYTLYAYLSESHVKMGQKVEKGEPIGTTGFYPQADGPGLYFELRFGQKAVNPMDWLSSSG